ncbi:DEAD/DEAH box helicase family protein [Paenibacillus sp. UMB7766-LJ446]|uniref:DEAD/DEAH box helicase family protein n=1 Tax=Paenibacillus sp. UMB7766-LJ446 TaxID=3046313 RepID=UPI0025510BD0|nr:DEAD/DEAH box helicase family protein [Paenibacillus sp. UMB7766-LJ446]MDK8193140.1 DEAD/DEAH box helicase family protein [Paenibacillus sp. UMB7766-LJ446]
MDTAMQNMEHSAEVRLDDIQNITDYLQTFGEDLIRRLNEEYVPVHHPGTDGPLEILKQIKRPLFNAQAHVTTALLKGFSKHKRLFLIGEMGTGKTSVSIATFFAALFSLLNGKGRVIYMVPNHLLKKTEREIGLLLERNAYRTRILSGYQDVIKLKNSGEMLAPPEKMEIFIIARDTCKLSYMYEPVARWIKRTIKKKMIREGEPYKTEKTIFEGWICPDCGQQLMKEEEQSIVPLEYQDFYNKHGKPARRKNNLTCTNQVRLYKSADPEQDEYRVCGARLWAAKNKNKSNISGEKLPSSGVAPRKVSPAELFHRYFKNKFDIAIGDECHELTGGSAQAHAFHVLMGCAKYSLAMTGTLMNGYASNLFELIFRMFPQRLKAMGFSWGDVGKWIDLYGVREKTTKIPKNEALNSSSNGSSVKVSTKELPAAAPQLFTDILSDVACFIQMADMFEILPKLNEGPMFISMDGQRKFTSTVTTISRRPRTEGSKKWTKPVRMLAPYGYLERNLTAVSKQLKRAVEKELQSGGQSVLLGSLVNTLLSYPDVPFNFAGVYHPDTGQEIVSPMYRLSDRFIYPKEQELLKFVKARLKVGRKVGVYATYTGKMGTLERLLMLLEEQGIRAAILDSSVPGVLREEWIAKKEREGIEVLLTNPMLVSTGLDMLGFPSLFFYQTGHRLTIVRQSSRRHWRIGQKDVCETVYCGYKHSMQELAINLMATKMSAALALEGQFSEDGLSALTESSGGGSLANELAKRFIGNKIDGVESAESIWGTMSIDASQFLDSAEEQVDVAARDVLNADHKYVYVGESLDEAILSWIHERVPLDLRQRMESSIEHIVEQVEFGVNCLPFTQSSVGVEMEWKPEAIFMEERKFRKWLFSLSKKPVIVTPDHELKLTLISEGQLQSKRKKSYNVTDEQVAFNF